MDKDFQKRRIFLPVLIMGITFFFLGFTNDKTLASPKPASATNITIYANDSPYHTGRVYADGFCNDGYVRVHHNDPFGHGEASGWMRFDTSPIPDDATINSVRLSFYPYFVSSGGVKIRLVGLLDDPVSDTCAERWDSIHNIGNTLGWIDKLTSTAWVTYNLGVMGVQELGLALSYDFFAIGFDHDDPDLSVNTQIYGHDDSSYIPYITVNYTPCDIPSKPSLNTPGNNTQTSSLRPTFDWSTASNATSYDFQIADNSSFTSLQVDISVDNDYWVPDIDLYQAPRYWRVRGVNQSGNCSTAGSWSNTFIVYITPFNPPALVSPGDGQTVNTSNPTLDWSDVPNIPYGYGIQVDNNSDFSSPILDVGESISQYTVGATYSLDNGTYYWRVRVGGSYGCYQCTTWSSTRSFIVQADSCPTVPAIPDNVQSSDGTFTDRIKTTWDATTCATYYEVTRSTGSAAGPYDDFLGQTSNLYWDYFVNDSNVRWFTVSACNIHGCSYGSRYDPSGGYANIPGAPEIDVRFQDNGVSIPDGDATPSTSDGTDFGNADTTSGSISHWFRIWNDGTATLNLTGNPRVVIGGTHASDFTVNVQPSTPIGGGGNSVQFEVIFNPSGTGVRTATISIANDDTNENPYNFSIQGMGTSTGTPEIAVRFNDNGVDISDGDTTPSTSDGTDFGNADTSSGSVSRWFRVWNDGTAVLNLTGNPYVVISGVHASDFIVNFQPGPTANPGGSTQFEIIFNPSGTGLRTAAISIANNDSDENPYNFSIQGMGTSTSAPEIDVRFQDNGVSIPDGDATPSTSDGTDFGNADTTSGSISHWFRIWNDGTATLNLTGNPRVVIGGTHASDFTVNVQPSTPIGGGGNSVQFEVIFNPSGTGVRTATISIANDDTNENPYNFSIQGTGIDSGGTSSCNTAPITINDYAAAVPYPSSITITNSGTSITDINIQLLGLSHTFPDDLDILLVSPQGQNLIIMSDAGSGVDVVNLNLIIDDDATEDLPDNTTLAQGSYRPANYVSGDSFPPPAPTPSSQTTLSSFNGTNPNGSWELYIFDDAGGDIGSLSGGWCLDITSTAVTFNDVPTNHWAWQYIESLYNAGITGGCGAGNYCPDNQVTRAQMAVFLLRGIHGSGYTPPAATGTVFNDVGASDFAAAWIEQMVSEGITSGCGGGNYCPNATVTRAQMAVFLLRAKYGSGYTPPAATGTVFNDVPSNGFAASWIEQLVSEGVTSGCGGGIYCPNAPVTRAQMAVFLVRIFNLPSP